ncbi:MAG: SPOR domain-containing protein [Treponema sp.]|nr:SPOR domain-containing protein [Treponema sp.]
MRNEQRAKCSKLYCALFLVLFMGFFVRLDAQSVFLAPEIERLERLAANPAQRQDALYQLARLYQLSGNREKAFETWSAAINAQSGIRDDNAWLEAIKLLISMGEYERASAELRTLISSASDWGIMESALYLSAQIEVFGNGNPNALSALVDNPGYAGLLSRIYYTLWKASDDAAWKNRLLGSYPRSPEAEIARDTNGVIAAITPQWLFFSPRDSSSPAAPVIARQEVPPAPTVVATPTPVAPTATAVPTAIADNSVMLQTGLFSVENNAKALAQRLLNAGFTSVITTRRVNGIDYWAVNVPAGQNVNRTIAELKNAGFDSFPVN